jgi:hypothetical protein
MGALVCSDGKSALRVMDGRFEESHLTVVEIVAASGEERPRLPHLLDPSGEIAVEVIQRALHDLEVVQVKVRQIAFVLLYLNK